MNQRLCLTLLIAILASPAWLTPTALADVASEIKAVDAKITAKYRQGLTSESDLAAELKDFDTLLAAHKDGSQDDQAEILNLKAMVYKFIIKDTEKADALLAQLARDFPASKQGRQLQHQSDVKKLQAKLAEGTVFPDFEEKDVNGKPLSIKSLKGKVVLLDFWATWCNPCKAELPNVLDTYAKHHAGGFEVIGISLDDDREKLIAFTTKNKMEWPQFFDGNGWKNKLAEKYGVESIPATWLLDGQGRVIARNLRGEALEKAVSAALSAK